MACQRLDCHRVLRSKWIHNPASFSPQLIQIEREEGVRMAESISDHAGNKFEANDEERNCLEGKAEECLADDSDRTPIHPDSRTEWNDASAPWRRGEFYKSLSSEAMSQVESAGTPFCCPENAVLFAEEQQPCFVLFLLEGRVKLSMNSIGGRRLILGLSRPGDILGLTFAISGLPYEMTAEAQYPCRLRSVPRQIFLDFILRNSVASQNVARELSLEYKETYAQLRLLGLASTAPEKLARLLIDWCSSGQQTEHGIRIQCALTHGEIGEHIYRFSRNSHSDAQ